MTTSLRYSMTAAGRRAFLWAFLLTAMTVPLRAQATECVLTAQPDKRYQLSAVLVRAGKKSFLVNVRNLADVELRVPRWPGDLYRVRVSGAIAFEGTMTQTELTVHSTLQSLDQMVTLHPKVTVAKAYSSDRGVIVNLEVPYCPGKPPVEILRSTRVPCQSLSFAYETEPSEWPQIDGEEGWDEELQTWGTLVADTRELRIFSSPRWRSYSLVLSWSTGTGPFRVLEERGDWLRVRHRWYLGATVKGWIPRRLVHLEQIDGTIGANGALPHCESRYLPSLSDMHSRSALTPPENLAVRVARVRAGTRVANADGAWGIVVRETVFDVEDSGDTRIKLVSLPGLSGNGLQAWVPRTQVTFLDGDE